MLAERLFHAAGPATENALDPSFVRVLGTSKCPSVADHSSSSRITPKYINELLVRFFLGTEYLTINKPFDFGAESRITIRIQEFLTEYLFVFYRGVI